MNQSVTRTTGLETVRLISTSDSIKALSRLRWEGSGVQIQSGSGRLRVKPF